MPRLDFILRCVPAGWKHEALLAVAGNPIRSESGRVGRGLGGAPVSLIRAPNRAERKALRALLIRDGA